MACNAADVRAAIWSRSCSANAASNWIVILLAWGLSQHKNETPDFRRPVMKWVSRASRSSLAITSVALCFFAIARALASFGRWGIGLSAGLDLDLFADDLPAATVEEGLNSRALRRHLDVLLAR